MSSGVGVEKTFPLFSPKIAKIEVVARGKARRAKLFYIRDKATKEAARKIRAERLSAVEAVADETAVAPEPQPEADQPSAGEVEEETEAPVTDEENTETQEEKVTETETKTEPEETKN